MCLYAVSAAEAAGRNTMRHLLRRTAGALLALFVVAAFAAPHALGALSRPAVEKAPSPEAVNEWESAVFIARASGAALFAWRIVSSDGTALYDAAAAPEYFPGLRVQGADTRRSRPRSPRSRPLPCRKRPCRRQLPPPPRPRRFRAARCSVCLPVSLRSRSFSARSL